MFLLIYLQQYLETIINIFILMITNTTDVVLLTEPACHDGHRRLFVAMERGPTPSANCCDIPIELN